MTSIAQLLVKVHDIADPCEELQQGFRALATDPSIPSDVQQASLDLADAIEKVFLIAQHYIVKEKRQLQVIESECGAFLPEEVGPGFRFAAQAKPPAASFFPAKARREFPLSRPEERPSLC